MGKCLILTCLTMVYFVLPLSSQGHDHTADSTGTHVHDGHDHSGHDHSGHNHGDSHEAHGHEAHGHEAHGEHAPFDPAATAIHHISDANVYTILEGIGFRIPLPVILYAPSKGWDVFLSSKFHVGHHEDGHASWNGYVMHHGSVYRVMDDAFPAEGSAEIQSFTHKDEEVNGKKIQVNYALSEGKEYRLDARSTLDGGILGGGITSFYDFSVTKNVLSMILVSLFLFWAFRSAVKAYRARPDKAPRGIQAVLEPMFTFIRDEVAIPFIGKEKYLRFLPLLMSIFFFILGLNLFGQVPFLGGINVTGNLTVTMIMAVVVFFVVNLNGKKDYWMHVFWMPNVPVAIKPLLAAVEIMGLFIKPLTLMLRLAGNISAGHIAILSFIGLIFIFGESGASMGGGVIGTAMAIPLTLFMMAIELIVAFVQAFVFTILTASYIGAAIEEHHHADHHHEGHH
jgi:F-type H+-transporting ATPase subunit a